MVYITGSANSAAASSNRAETRSKTSTVESTSVAQNPRLKTINDTSNHVSAGSRSDLGTVQEGGPTTTAPRQLFLPFLSTEFRQKAARVPSPQPPSDSRDKTLDTWASNTTATATAYGTLQTNSSNLLYDTAVARDFSKPKFDAESPRRQLSMSHVPCPNERATPATVNQNSLVPGRAPQSLSWAESSCQRQQYTHFDGLVDPLIDPYLDSILANTKAEKTDTPLDGWALDRSRGRMPEKHIAATPEGWAYVRSIPKKAIVELAM
jgi:hypothetical protein